MNADQRILALSGITILMWGLWGFFGKMALERKMGPLNIFFAEVVISVACAVPIGFLLFRSTDLSSLTRSWNLFGVFSGTGLVLGLLFYYLALDRGQASIIVPLTATYPLVAVLLSFAILGERPSLAQWLGIVLTILGVALLLSGPISKPSQP